MPPPANEYDYVVVGAGSAGCVLANRLSAGGNSSVLLLEAGGSDRHPNVRIPAAFSKLFKTGRDWDFVYGPEPGLDGRTLYLPRGRMLGGSSSMNAMIYIRGHRADYDAWRDAGCEGWGADDVLALFRRSEHNTRLRGDFHGGSGELDVTDLRTVNPLSLAFVDACESWGLERTADFNGSTQDGAGLFQVTQRKGSRWSAAQAFLAPARERDNLTVQAKALAHRIVVEGGRATGVEYSKGGGQVHVRARREVIVAAGAIGSPQLLMLSGIGPADHLTERGIEVVVDLPVGDNLQDHPAVMAVYDCPSPVTLDDAESARHLAIYALRRRGKLSSNVGEAGAFLRTDAALSAPDLELHFGPAYFVRHGFEDYDGNAFSIGPTLLTPHARGTVRLRSVDPHDKPVIVGNHLTDPDDVARLASGVRISREIAHTSPFDAYRGKEIYPGQGISTDEELAAYLRRCTELIYHPVGTCAMGRAGQAVVDPELRVNGIDALRVADASIMPTITRGNTNAPTMMIAEKASELIRAAG